MNGEKARRNQFLYEETTKQSDYCTLGDPLPSSAEGAKSDENNFLKHRSNNSFFLRPVQLSLLG